MTARDPDVNPMENLLNARTNADAMAKREALYLMSMAVCCEATHLNYSSILSTSLVKLAI